MTGTATISADGRYRYDLTRSWSDGPTVLFVMLNPSKADATTDDQTIRRCIYFADRDGFGRLVVCNLYAYRATHPEELLKLGSPAAMGPENPDTIQQWCASEDVLAMVCAWGAHKLAGALARLNVEAIAHQRGLGVWCLGRTVKGAPRHPSRLPNDAELEPWGPYR